MKELAKCKFFFFILFTIFSCSKDEPLLTLSKDKAVELISTSHESYTNLIKEFYSLNLSANLEYFESLLQVSGYPIGNFSINDFGQAFPTTFDYINQVYSIPDGTNTPLGDYGTYTWNFTNENWEYSSEPNNRVVYLFPSNELSEENDAKLQLESYVLNEVDEVTLPMKFIMTLRVDDIFISSTNYEAFLQNDRLSRLSIGFNQNPFSSLLNVQSKSTSNGHLATVTYNLKKDNVTHVSSKLELHFSELIYTSSLFLNWDENFEQLKTMKGYVQTYSLKYTFDFNLVNYRMENSLEQIESSANSNLKINLYAYPSGEPVASIKWNYRIENNELIPILVYSDSSIDPALPFIPDIVKKLIDAVLN